MIRVALRFDDPSATSDASLEDSIFHVLARCGIPATVAVIPFSRVEHQYIALTTARAEHLIRACDAGTIEVALHGNSHEALPSEDKSEFRGLPAALQHGKLADGLRQLRSLFGDVITGFVPPFNSYDAVTAQCVATLGLRYLSAEWSESLVERLVFLPRTCQIAELKDAIAEARCFPRLKPIVIPVLHHYDFRESGSPEEQLDLATFETLLTWLAEQDDVQTLTLGALAAELSSTATRATLRRRMRFHHLHWRLQSRLPQKFMTNAGWFQMALGAFLK